MILKLAWKAKEIRMAKTILKKNKVRGIPLSDFKTFYKATVTKIKRKIHNETEMSPEVDPHNMVN